MARTINVEINGQFVRKDNKNAGVMGEGNVTTMSITFDETWRGYGKRIIWRDANGENPVSIVFFEPIDATTGNDPLSADITIPREPLEIPGWCSFSIEGYKEEAGVHKTSFSVSDYLFVQESDSFNKPAEPTPSQAQQIFENIGNLHGYIEDAKKEIMPLDLVALMRRTNQSISGLSWSWSADKTKITVSGTQTETSIYPLLAKSDAQIPEFSAGNWYYLEFRDDLAHVLIRAQNGSGVLSYIDLTEPSYFFIPDKAELILVSIIISYDEEAATVSKTIQSPKIYKQIPQAAITNQFGKVSCRLGISEANPSEEECNEAFVEEVNKRCAQFGMENTHIENASGYDADLSAASSQMSVSDMARLTIACSDKSDLLSLLSLDRAKIQIYGRNRREVELENTYLSAIKAKLSSIGAYAMGGKGGSLDYGGNNKFRTQITFADICGKATALCLMGQGSTSFENIYSACKDLASCMQNVYEGSEPVITSNMNELVSSGGGYAAFEIPKSGSLYVNQVSTDAILSRFPSVFSGITSMLRPCSAVKLMTALVALDFIVDKSSFLELSYNEVSIGGSGSQYYSSDRINVMDALRAMLVESSNVLATAIGRYTGQIILTGRP